NRDRKPLLARRRDRGRCRHRVGMDRLRRLRPCQAGRLGVANRAGGGHRLSSIQRGSEMRLRARNALIESRLTPNAISLTGFVLNVLAAVLVTQRYFFLAGVSFIVGSVMDTLDGRYSRMPGKGTPFGAFRDSTLDRVGG